MFVGCVSERNKFAVDLGALVGQLVTGSLLGQHPGYAKFAQHFN